MKSRIAAFSKNDPSSIARSIWPRSIATTRPAPIFMCPTSELPIWPAGRPTSGPWVTSVAWGQVAMIRSKFGVVGQDRRVGGLDVAAGPSRRGCTGRRVSRWSWRAPWLAGRYSRRFTCAGTSGNLCASRRRRCRAVARGISGPGRKPKRHRAIHRAEILRGPGQSSGPPLPRAFTPGDRAHRRGSRPRGRAVRPASPAPAGGARPSRRRRG